MAEMVKVKSFLPMPMRLTEKHPDPEKPGNSPELRSVILSGRGAVDEVDAEVFHQWVKDNPHHPLVVGEHFVTGKDAEAEESEQFGWEPGLEKVAKEASEDASKGSSVKGRAPVKDSDMAATSRTPNDDSPRSQVGPNPPLSMKIGE